MKRINASVLKPHRKDKTTIAYRFAFAFLIASMALIVSCAGTSASTATNQMQDQMRDQIQLKLLGGDAGDLVSELVLSAGTSSPPPIELKECAAFPLSYEVLVGGNPSTATYTLAVMSDPAINSYTKTTYNDVSLILSEGSTEIETFTPLTVTTAECRTTEAAEALSGAGTSGAPYIIDNDRKLNLLSELVNANAMNSANMPYAGAHYGVTVNIDLGVAEASWSEMGSTSTSGGFAPIGTSNSDPGIPFTGTFDCGNNEIANLYINRASTSRIGLFGYVSNATIQNCGLTAVKVTGSNGVGSLVGRISGSTISNSYAIGSVSGVTIVGGLVGENDNSSAISNSYAASSVSGSGNTVGGLVGENRNQSTISDSYATGSVTRIGSAALTGNNFGGLVGWNNLLSTISDSYATGMVSGADSIGGLVGQTRNESMISNSYATGAVLGSGNNVGGLVGFINVSSTVSRSYAIGSVTGMNVNVGGLVGYINSSSMISSSYAAGVVSGNSRVGGLVGLSELNSMISNSYATGVVSGDNRVGGLVGVNEASSSTITNSYAIGNVTGMTGGTHIGLFIGFNGDGSTPGYTGVTASYYNSDSTLTGGTSTTGVGSDTDGDSSRTTVNVTGQSMTALQSLTATATGWDGAIWQFTPTTQYPRLKTVACANRQYTNPVPTTCTDL